MSSIESAPSAIPATSDITFMPAFAPADPGNRQALPGQLADADRSRATASAGTRPAETIRFGSSNAADIEAQA